MGLLLSKHATRILWVKPPSNEQDTESQNFPFLWTEQHRSMYPVVDSSYGLPKDLQNISSETPLPGAQSIGSSLNPLSPVATIDSNDNTTAIGSTEPSRSSPTRNERPDGPYGRLSRLEVRHPITDEPLFEGRIVNEKFSLKILDSSLADALRSATIDAAGVYRHEEIFSPASTIHDPCEFIIHNWSKIESHMEGDKKGHSGQSIRRLLEFFKKRYTITLEKLDQINKGGCTKIAFEDLWLIYPPGATVFREDDGGWRAYKVERVESCPNGRLNDMSIYAYYLDFDKSGRCFIPHLEVLTVPYYSSSRAIRNLGIIPEWYLRDCDDLLIRLERRGQDYVKYKEKVSYMEYSGDAWPMTSSTTTVKVIVDYITPSKYNQNTDPSHISRSSCAVCRGNDINLYSYPRDSPHDPEICIKGAMTQEQQHERAANADPPWLFFPPTIWAFSLWHKTWKKIPSGSLVDVEPDGNALKALRMDNDLKSNMESMVAAYANHGHQRDGTDVMSGKGGGINVLLHGMPGTGKTMTVECLAEKYGCALYMVTCGDLSTDPDVFEQRLCEIFLRAKNWNAILLLDEADVFIGARGLGDLRRNAIVSIFLRYLEYSEVFFFMTTNQLNKLDMALESRIHMAIPFHPLYLDDQKAIWKDSILRLKGSIPEDDVRNLVDFINYRLEELDGGVYTKMNGRQIRNCVSAALTLARAKESRPNLDWSHIRRVLQLGRRFADFMQDYCIHVVESEQPYIHEKTKFKTVALAGGMK